MDTVGDLRARLLAAKGDRNVAEALEMLDAVLDSPLDLDSSFFERMETLLRGTPRISSDIKRHLLLLKRIGEDEDQSTDGPESAESGEEPKSAVSRGLAALTAEMQGMNRVMQGHVDRIKEDRASAESVREIPESGVEPAAKGASSTEDALRQSIQIRGLHVRQGGHHFVLPIDRIERALNVRVSELPTVRGGAVARFSGEMCDVIHLAAYLGLTIREDSEAAKLLVISESGARVCLAIDEVVGPVETKVTALEGILPRVTGLVGVATLESGGLALVPELSRLLPSKTA